jgi:hypothetical protein
MDTMEFHEPPLRKGPKGFDSINMSFPIGEFVGSMVDTIMLFEAKVNQTAVTTPRVRMDYAIRINASTNNGLQCFPGAVRDNLCVYMTATLQDTENWRLSVGSTAALSFDALGSEIGFVDLDFSPERGRNFAIFGDSFSDQLQVAIDRISIQSGQESDFLCVQIEDKVPHKFSKFGLRNS